MLRVRVLTAAVALPLMFYGILHLSQFYFELCTLVLFGIAIHEATRIFLSKEGVYEKITFVGMTLLLSFFTYTDFTVIDIYVFIFLYFAYFLFRNLALNRQGTTVGRKTLMRNFRNLTAILFFALFVGVPFALAVKIRSFENGPYWLLILISFSWGGDTGAYFAGRFLKKYFPYRLFPVVSPNKTWIGAVGSILSAVGFTFLFVWILKMKVPVTHVLIISIFGNALAQLGDLFESFIKRVYKIKDSGSIVPGHGGILDRFDSFFFATPFLFWYLDNIYFG